MIKTISDEIIEEIQFYAEDEYAQWTAPILQITKGGYGESDKLYGVRVPNLRKISKKYFDINIDTIEQLLHNEYHEVRLLALFILNHKFKKYKQERSNIVKFYLNNADYINNWDLVDMSAPYILGEYLYENQDKLDILDKLSNSNHLWKERIAIVSTQYLIKQGFYEPTIKLSEKYISHPHHLIHKATGWMLRELGKKDINELYSFLDKYANIMPRVMLRYSIERLNQDKRKYYMDL